MNDPSPARQPGDSSDASRRAAPAPQLGEPAAASSPNGDDSLPSAQIKDGIWTEWRRKLGSRMWLFTGAAAVLAIALTAASWRSSGPRITVSFKNGFGIEAGDALRHRGIDVGQVERVALSDDLQQVDVVIRLDPKARDLARDGSRFWVQRAQVGLSGVKGVDTLVGPKYLGVQPGPAESPRRTHFVGEESPRELTETDALPIRVRFRQGHGLAIGAAVMFRGVQVGEVVDVGLTEDLGHVDVGAQLSPGAAHLAREGTLFWIERPHVGVAQLRGLETLVGGRHLAVAPGPLESPPQLTFEGSDVAPAEVEQGPGLEVVLEGDGRNGLQSGSPVVYRGIEIGAISHVSLASDGATVEARARIRHRFGPLVRNNSQFWNNSGLDLQIGLKGVKLDAESLATIAAGGVALATPTAPGAAVATGHRFPLHAKAESEWLSWRPRIGVGAALLPQPPPPPLRASFHWPTRAFGIRRVRESNTWTNLLSDGWLVTPRGEFWPADGALAEPLEVQIDGQVYPVTDGQALHNELVKLHVPQLQQRHSQHWPAIRCRHSGAPEDCLLLTGAETLPLAAGRIRASADGPWIIDTSLPLNADWHGAAAVAMSDGALVGVVVWRDDQAFLAPCEGQRKSSDSAE